MASNRLTRVPVPSLARQLGIVSATALVVSNMVGAGIFGTTGHMTAALGDPLLILAAWTAGAVFAFAGALCYAELGVNFPSSGGEYVYLNRAFGPMWGFMTGWVSFFAGFSAPIASTALIFASYIQPFFPQSNPNQMVTAGPFGVGFPQVIASGLIALFTVLNCFGIRRMAKVQNILTASKLVILTGLVFFGFLLGWGSWQHFTAAAPRSSHQPVVVDFVIQLLWVMVAYSGWNAATYVAEEIDNPSRTLPRALLGGTVIVAILYLGLNLVFIYSTPPTDLKGVTAVGQLAASNLFGPAFAGPFSALMAISIMSTTTAMITIGPRVYYAMALNGAFPSIAVRVHPRWRTPIAAILSQGLCAIILTATPIPSLFTFIGFSLTIFSVLAVIALLVLRRRQAESWRRLQWVNAWFPLFPATYILAGTCMVAWGVVFQPTISATALGMMAAGAVVYRVFVRA